MVSTKSLDLYIQTISALVHDVQTRMDDCCFTSRAARLTVRKLQARYAFEGPGFLTKALPSLGKALDCALHSESQTLTVPKSFARKKGTQLPILFGELFSRVFDNSGRLLTSPCVASVRHLRTLLFVFYKLELPYAPKDEQKVISTFVKTEAELQSVDTTCRAIATVVNNHINRIGSVYGLELNQVKPDLLQGVIRDARNLLERLFRDFDPREIRPKHGPGVVSTKETLNAKFKFTRINPRIQEKYPFDAYFCASLGHYCDEARFIEALPVTESLARVMLVPKDSRGPRLISCEPLENQWIQQGLSKAIVKLVEDSTLTRYNVHFTDQAPNQRGALVGSRTGRYATLDLKEASDRVSIGLVRLLFPKVLADHLESCRSLGTILPEGSEIMLQKYAPMGSALCFPVMALTIWALATAASTDQDARDSILVYGDDLIVRSDQTERVMWVLTCFGLQINRDKSCYHGLFRESCGVDAFKGEDVTPVRIRTRWKHRRAADCYTSWVDYSNHMYRRGYRGTSETIARWLLDLYGPIPSGDMNLSCPSLLCLDDQHSQFKVRTNKHLQRREWRVPTIVNRSIKRSAGGWRGLLRWFTEGSAYQLPNDRPKNVMFSAEARTDLDPSFLNDGLRPFRVRQYTRRNTTKVVWRWLSGL